MIVPVTLPSDPVVQVYICNGQYGLPSTIHVVGPRPLDDIKQFDLNLGDLDKVFDATKTYVKVLLQEHQAKLTDEPKRLA
ncbi:MAG: hypothetical protein WC869_00655 [Phycisphaerae bacterium]|jgi:hypothetical protein